MSLRRWLAGYLALGVLGSLPLPIAHGEEAGRCCCREACPLEARTACHPASPTSTPRLERGCPSGGGTPVAGTVGAVHKGLLPSSAGIEAPAAGDPFEPAPLVAPDQRRPTPPTPPPERQALLSSPASR
jgi:hypothetical protein